MICTIVHTDFLIQSIGPSLCQLSAHWAVEMILPVLKVVLFQLPGPECQGCLEWERWGDLQLRPAHWNFWMEWRWGLWIIVAMQCQRKIYVVMKLWIVVVHKIILSSMARWCFTLWVQWHHFWSPAIASPMRISRDHGYTHLISVIDCVNCEMRLSGDIPFTTSMSSAMRTIWLGSEASRSYFRHLRIKCQVMYSL